MTGGEFSDIGAVRISSSQTRMSNVSLPILTVLGESAGSGAAASAPGCTEIRGDVDTFALAVNGPGERLFLHASSFNPLPFGPLPIPPAPGESRMFTISSSFPGPRVSLLQVEAGTRSCSRVRAIRVASRDRLLDAEVRRPRAYNDEHYRVSFFYDLYTRGREQSPAGIRLAP